MTAPLLLLLVLPLAAAAIALARPGRDIAGRLAAGAAAITLAMALWLAARVQMEGAVGAFSGALRADPLALLLAALAAAVELLVALGTTWELGEAKRAGEVTAVDCSRFHAASLALLSAVTLAGLAGNLGLLWLALALATAAAVAMVAAFPNPAARAAAWSLAVQSAGGLALLLVGISLLEASGGAAGTLGWSDLVGLARGLDPALARLGSVLVLAGLAGGAALAPLHLWLVPAQAAVPFAAGALLSTSLIGASLGALLRISPILDATLGAGALGRICSWAGALTLAAAAAASLAAPGLRALLAASTLGFTGLFAVALGVGAPAVPAALALLASHALAKTLACLAGGDVARYFGGDGLPQLRGALAARTATAAALLLALLALAGLPPGGLFGAGLTIVAGAFAGGRGLAAGLGLALAVATAGKLLVVVHQLAIPPERAAALRSRRGDPVALTVTLVLAGAVALLGLASPLSLERWYADAALFLRPPTPLPDEPDLLDLDPSAGAVPGEPAAKPPGPPAPEVTP